MPLGICKIILKGMSAVTRAIYAPGEITIQASLAVTTAHQATSSEARSCARGPIKADFNAPKD
jgi:hypothetical protein